MVLEKNWVESDCAEDSDSSSENEEHVSSTSEDSEMSEMIEKKKDSDEENESENRVVTEESDDEDSKGKDNDKESKKGAKAEKDDDHDDVKENKSEYMEGNDSSKEEITNGKDMKTSEENKEEETEESSNSEKDKYEDLDDNKTNEYSKSSSPNTDEMVFTVRLPSQKKDSPKTIETDSEDTVKTVQVVEKTDTIVINSARLEDKMKETSKNLMEEIRKKQGGKIEDKIKRLVSKSTKKESDEIKSVKKITGLSKNAELKLKLEENFKKRGEKLEKRSDFEEKTKVANLICRDIIAAKKDQIDKKLETTKLDEVMNKPVKKIQKINLDLKNKLEQGLDFNKTRRTGAKSEIRMTKEKTEETNVGSIVDSDEEDGVSRTDKDEITKETRKNDGKVKSSVLLDLEIALKNKKATPHLSSKRKSVNGRKLRPKSVVDSAEGMSADDIPDLLPSLPTSAEESLDSVTELPVSVGTQLQHLVKSRPRRTKTRAPTRATPPALIGQEDIDDGLDAFFLASGSGVASVSNTPILSPLSDDNSSVSSLVTDTPSPHNNNHTPSHPPPEHNATPSHTSSSLFTSSTQGKTTTLPHLKSRVVSDDVPRSRSSDNVGTQPGSQFGKLRANTVDLGDSSCPGNTIPNSLNKIDGTQHLKRNTKISGTAVELIKAKKFAADCNKVPSVLTEPVISSVESASTSSDSTPSSLTSSTISTSTSSNITVSSIIKIRTAALTDSATVKSSSNGIPPKSPLPSKYSKDKGFEFSTGSNADKLKAPSAVLLGGSAKQRPWSMMDQNVSLDINSSGPSSLPLHINERRSSVKAMAANLNKQGSESPELKKKPTLDAPVPGSGSVRGFGKRPVPQPRPSIGRSSDSHDGKETECRNEPFSLPPVFS